MGDGPARLSGTSDRLDPRPASPAPPAAPGYFRFR